MWLDVHRGIICKNDKVEISHMPHRVAVMEYYSWMQYVLNVL